MPITVDVTALIVWRGEVVIHHDRGSEAALCQPGAAVVVRACEPR
jgi:hypothetical protein